MNVDEKPCADALLPLNDDRHHNDHHHTHAERRRAVDKGSLHGLEDVLLAGVAPVGQRAHTRDFPIDLHAAAVVAAARPAAFGSVQVHQEPAGVEGGVQAGELGAFRDGGSGWRGAVGVGSEGDAS